MRDVYTIVRYSGGSATLIDVARAVGPHGSLRYGYAIVDRAIAAGLVRIGPPLHGRRGRSLVLA